MRAKLDENLPVEATELLRTAGWDCDTVHDEGLAGADDPIVAAKPSSTRLRRTPEAKSATMVGAMKSVAATEARNRLGAILDAAQREPIVIRRQDRDIAVVMSMVDYERLRSGSARAYLGLRDAVAAEAAQAGLTDDRLAERLRADAP